MIAYSANYLLN